MVLPHNLRSRVSMMRPEPVGICDRCGFMEYLFSLSFQFQWGAQALINQRILVCCRCLDTPSEFLKTPIIGPEPAPLPNARPTYYAYQNQGGQPPLNSVSEILEE